MENTKEHTTKKFILAAFILVGFSLFVVALFVIGSKQNLFTPTFRLSSIFETVSGLKTGSSVRFNGINVGSVDEIEITGVDKVKIQMTIDNSVRPFIKTDSRATVITEGLVGNKIVEITSGSADLPSVKDGDMVVSVKPIDAEDIFKTLMSTGENADSISKEISNLFVRVNQGQGTIGQLITNDKLYRTMDQTITNYSQSSQVLNQAINKISSNVDAVSSDITRLTPRLREITDDIAGISRKINSSESVVGTLLTDTVFARNLKDVIVNANKTTEHLEEGSKGFSENMEALKHNFLFKGYFEDIGYWDKTGKSLNEKENELKQKEKELNEKEKRLNEMEEDTTRTWKRQ